MLSIETYVAYALDLLVTMSSDRSNGTSCGFDHRTSIAFLFWYDEAEKSLKIILHAVSLESCQSHKGVIKAYRR